MKWLGFRPTSQSWSAPVRVTDRKSELQPAPKIWTKSRQTGLNWVLVLLQRRALKHPREHSWKHPRSESTLGGTLVRLCKRPAFLVQWHGPFQEMLGNPGPPTWSLLSQFYAISGNVRQFEVRFQAMWGQHASNTRRKKKDDGHITHPIQVRLKGLTVWHFWGRFWLSCFFSPFPFL